MGKIRVEPSRAANPQSPEGRKYSSGRKTRSPDSKRNRSPLSRGSPFKRSRTSKTPDKHAEDKRKSKEKSKVKKDQKPRESSEEKKAREEKEYQERLSKLPSPEREKMEARRKKFEKSVPEIEGTKKISLKSSTVEKDTSLDSNKALKRSEGSVDDDGFALNADIGDTLDMFEEVDQENAPPKARKNVTDLRVQLHKK